jgi:hypothetical protein
MTFRRLSVLGTALGTIAAGLMAGSTVTAANASSAAAGQTVEVFVKRDHTVVMPTEIRPGVTKFKISSRRFAGFQLAQAAEGYTKAQAMRDLAAGFNKNNMRAMARFEENVRLLGGMASRRDHPATMSVNLPAGSYWALDSMPGNVDPAKVLTFEVTGDTVGGKLGGQVIRATGDATWGKMTPRITRKGVIRFQNTSDEPHFIAIAKLAKGKTMRDVREYMESGAEGPPPVNFNISVDSGVISGGESMSFKYRLPAGRYVMTCWWPMTDMGGMPHAMMGMYRGLRVG